MEILFLGTSSGWPLPRLGCKCKICISKDAKDQRLRPSLLIDRALLIDANPDIYFELKRSGVDPTKIKYIFLTHAHDDHIWGLYDLSHISNLENKIVVVSTPSVFKEAKRKVGISLLKFKQLPIKPFEEIGLGEFKVAFIPVEHSVEAYGVKISSTHSLFYAPEFRTIKKESLNRLKNLDLAVIDGSSKNRAGQTKGHETIEEGLKITEKFNPRQVFFTNIGHKTDTYKNLQEFVGGRGAKFNIAFDGLTIEV